MSIDVKLNLGFSRGLLIHGKGYFCGMEDLGG